VQPDHLPDIPRPFRAALIGTAGFLRRSDETSVSGRQKWPVWMKNRPMRRFLGGKIRKSGRWTDKMEHFLQNFFVVTFCSVHKFLPRLFA
jgi:hypothetical protein